mmetsp:Transcript_52019/g.110577  ORF Transcript_52019/g.110577 Transcript_52019/m.110577 type:complete len:412 (+) Transcript_52019:169-1404(+)
MYSGPRLVACDTDRRLGALCSRRWRTPDPSPTRNALDLPGCGPKLWRLVDNSESDEETCTPVSTPRRGKTAAKAPAAPIAVPDLAASVMAGSSSGSMTTPPVSTPAPMTPAMIQTSSSAHMPSVIGSATARGLSRTPSPPHDRERNAGGHTGQHGASRVSGTAGRGRSKNPAFVDVPFDNQTPETSECSMWTGPQLMFFPTLPTSYGTSPAMTSAAMMTLPSGMSSLASAAGMATGPSSASPPGIWNCQMGSPEKVVGLPLQPMFLAGSTLPNVNTSSTITGMDNDEADEDEAEESDDADGAVVLDPSVPPPPAPPTPADLDLPDGCPSVGSLEHPHNCADFCKYAKKARGCKDGAACVRCHICTSKKVVPQPQRRRGGTRRGTRGGGRNGDKAKAAKAAAAAAAAGEGGN